jgi:polar amino acid transport system substrate-binding protein
MQRREWMRGAAGLFGAAAVLGTGCASLGEAPASAVRQSLAPSGRLRVGFLASPLYASRPAAGSEWAGVAVDLGRELAARLGVPFEPVVSTTVPALLAGGSTAQWDVVLTGSTAERAAALDFTAPYMEVEWGYLARADAALADAGSIDRAGVRVGVVERASADALLSTSLRQATLVRVPSVAGLPELLDSGRADVVAATKATLHASARQRSDWRLLGGRLFAEPIGMAVPKGRDAVAARTLAAFVERAKRDGLVARAIERAGLHGVIVSAAAAG